MKKKKIALFLIINFIISWVIGFTGLFIGIQVFTNSYLILAVFYMFIPAISAVIVQKYIYNEKIIKPFGISFKINKWFLIAWLLPLVIAFSSLGIALLLPNVSYSPNMEGFLTQYKNILSTEQFFQLKNQLLNSNIPVVILITFQALLAGITVNAFAGLGEEIGWRGFLQNELSSLGFWKSSSLIGLIWGVWHTPLILMGHNYPNNPFLGIFIMTLIGIFLGPIFSFIRIKSRSVVAAGICHGTFNAGLSLSTLFLKGGSNLFIGMTGVSGLVILFILNLMIYTYLKTTNDSIIVSENEVRI